MKTTKPAAKFYEENKDKAIALVQKQREDNWTAQEIMGYWHSLDYDMFFINSVIKPAIYSDS